jgi:hypothetical protein
MQPHSSPPHRPSTAQAAAAERPNEFAEAAARLFQERSKRLLHNVPPPLPNDPPEHDDTSWSLRNALLPARDLRRALLIAPIAIVGYLVFWFLFIEPSQPSPPTSRVIEAKAEAGAAIDAPGLVAVRQDVVEVKAPAASSAALMAAPADPVVAPPAPPEASSAPLSRDEIKEMQGKLGAAGFTAGPVDGIVGPQTQAALRRYAQSRNLPKPEPTQEVLSRLRGETP